MQFIDTIDVKGQEYQFQASYDSDGNHIVTTYAKHTYVDNAIESAITDLIDSAPEALNTLKEISESLNNDEDFAGTMTSELSKKANTDDVYTKTEVDNIKKIIDSDITSNVNTLSAALVKKADITDVYSKTETYTKEQVNEIALTKANASDSYTKDQLYTKTEVDTAFSTLRSELPTKVSAFENDSEYLVWSQVEHFAEAAATNTALDGKVDKKNGYSLLSDENISKIAALPNVDQYNAKMDELNVAISNMSTNINQALNENDAQDLLIQANATALENKVDKAEGMGLSSNDYTTEDKELLQTLAAKIAELEAKVTELEAKHSENSEEPGDLET